MHHWCLEHQGGGTVVKWETSGYIKKETENNTGAGVSVDQLQSSQPGLVPHLLGKFTSAFIWATQVMVDHSSDLIYVYLMISIIQEETLSVKGDFENSLPHLEFKLKDIMQTMEYF